MNVYGLHGHTKANRKFLADLRGRIKADKEFMDHKAGLWDSSWSGFMDWSGLWSGLLNWSAVHGPNTPNGHRRNREYSCQWDHLWDLQTWCHYRDTSW